ncbi:MAG: formylglycine-generating enzyme family protein [Deltaproteobacteria bacterium]
MNTFHQKAIPMHAAPEKTFLILLMIVLFCPSSVFAAAETTSAAFAPACETRNMDPEQGRERKAVTVALVRRPGDFSGDHTFTSFALGATFALIPAGTFTMGSPAGEPGRRDDESRHQVTISRAFYMQTTEVTQKQWRKMMGSNPSYFSSCGDDCPVERVSWNDVQAFIRKLNQEEGTHKYRLPREAEWEYAARAGTTTPFSTGHCLNANQANYNGTKPLSVCPASENRQKTVRAGSLSPNAWGLYDMHGNVWEWVQDWEGNYPADRVTDPEGPPAGSVRMNRGGSWFSNAENCRSAVRDFYDPDRRDSRLGFRLLRTR